MNKICQFQILEINNVKKIWDKLNTLYKTTNIFSIIDLHHQLAIVKFNLWNLNVYTEKIKRIANEIKKLNNDNQDFINIFWIMKKILSNQIQLLSQIRLLLLVKFIIEKMTNLIHVQQVANSNLNSQDSWFSADLMLTKTDRKHKTNK